MSFPRIPRYAPAQREAILGAAAQHTPAVIRKMAREGDLGVPAFDPGVYIYTLIKQERQKLERQGRRCPTCGRTSANENPG